MRMIPVEINYSYTETMAWASKVQQNAQNVLSSW